MSYGLKYYARIADSSGNTYTLNLNKLDYVGSATEITHYAHSSPLRLQYRGGKDEQTIYPSSITFDLFRKSTDDFSDLLVSQYRDYQIEIIKNDSTTFWKGFLQPEGINTKLVADEYFISITCADGLLDLKSIEYPSTYVSGNTRIIEIVRNCLAQTGIDLPIIDQVNISEAHSTEPVLASIFANSNRFIDNKDGRTKYLNCYDTVARLLDSYYCQLAQSNGYWVITQRNEVNSKRHTYDNVALTATTTLYNRTIDISNYAHSYDSDQLSKIVPYKSVGITFQNRNIGSSVIANGNFNDGLNGWINGSGSTSSENFTFSANDNQLYVLTREPFLYEDADGIHSFSSSIFPLAMVTTADTLTVSIDARVFNIAFLEGGNGVNPHIEICLKYPDGSIARNVWQYIGNIITDDYSNYEHTFDIDQNGDYQVIFNIIPHETAPYEYVELLFDNITGIPAYGGDAEITFDKYSTGLNTGSTAVQKGSKTVFFGDSKNTGDLGGLLYSPTGLTSSWSNYDGSLTDVPLTQLLAYNILRSRSRFKNYVRITLVADSTIDFNSILSISGTKYSIVGMSHDLKTLFCELELVEFLEDSIGMTYNQYVLNTVDGESSGGGSSSDTSALETQFNSFVADTNSAISALEATTLQDVTENGNSTTEGIVLKNTANTKEWLLSVNTDGHLIMSGGTNQNLHVSGDVMAFSSLTPAPANWWSTAPLGSGLAYSGSSIVVTGSSTGGGSIGAIGTINAVTKSANGGVISGDTLYFQTADASYPGLVGTGTQTFAGAKTFTHTLTVNTNSSIYGVFNHSVSGAAYANLKFNSIDFGYWGQASGLVSGGADTDFALRAQNNLIFSIQDVEKMRLTNTGLGIGTSPSYNLDIATSSNAAMRLRATTTGAVDFILSRDGAPASLWDIYLPGGSTDMRFWNSGDKFNFTADGKMGIGVSPAEPLDVNGNIRLSGAARKITFGSSSGDYLMLQDVPSGANLLELSQDSVTKLSVDGVTGNLKWTGYNIGNPRSLKIGYSDGNYGGIGYNVGFTTTSDTWNYELGDTASQIMFISGGFRFLGTSTVGTPGNPITFSTLADINSSGNMAIGTTADASYRLKVADGSGGNQLKFVRGTGEVHFIQDNNANRLYVRATNNLILNDTGGNVGIGASPSFPLDVYSSVTAPTVNIRTDQNFQAGIRISRTVNTPTTWELYVPAGSTDIRLYNASFGDRFTFTNSGNFTATGEVTAFSDRRLKENICEYKAGLDAIKKIEPVLYNLKNDNSRKHIGVIAQDVQQIEPLLVEDTNGTLSVNYQKISVLLINAVKELSSTVDELRKQNEELLKRIEVLEENNTKKTRNKK